MQVRFPKLNGCPLALRPCMRALEAEGSSVVREINRFDRSGMLGSFAGAFALVGDVKLALDSRNRV